MPMVHVKLIEGVFSDAQKREMIHKLTDAMVAIEGESMRPVTWVIIEEVKSGDWGIGGKAMTAADVHALAGTNGTTAASSPAGKRARVENVAVAERSCA